MIRATSSASPLSAVSAEAIGLRGSPESMRNQHDVAVKNDYEFMGNPAELRSQVEFAVSRR